MNTNEHITSLRNTNYNSPSSRNDQQFTSSISIYSKAVVKYSGHKCLFRRGIKIPTINSDTSTGNNNNRTNLSFSNDIKNSYLAGRKY